MPYFVFRRWTDPQPDQLEGWHLLDTVDSEAEAEAALERNVSDAGVETRYASASSQQEARVALESDSGA